MTKTTHVTNNQINKYTATIMTPLLLLKSHHIIGLLLCLCFGNLLWNVAILRHVTGNNDDDAINFILPYKPKQQNNHSNISILTSSTNSSRFVNASTSGYRPKLNTTTIHKYHQVAGLNCNRFQGGPYNEYSVREMVYWEDIPTDATYRSPYYQPQQEEQFLTFEPDGAGWNNKRMAMETVVAIAVAMGRTLVLPPDMEIKRLNANNRNVNTNNVTDESKQKNQFSFTDFFHFESITKEHDLLGGTVKVITMEEFLNTQALTGKMVSNNHPRRIAYPPQNNRTNWNGVNMTDTYELFDWLRKTATMSLDNWYSNECVAIFPKVEDGRENNSSTNITGTSSKWIEQLVKTEEYKKWPTYEKYIGKPVPVDAPPSDRLKEMWADRDRLCIYSKEYQNAPHLHLPYILNKSRLLVHFYAFVFFEDWKNDLWMKRFMRDHIRYVDEIQCAAARVVQAIRKRVKLRELQRQRINNGAIDSNNSNGDDMEDLSNYTFDTFHIRRGDFQRFYSKTQIKAAAIVRRSKGRLQPNGTIYIATDEKNRRFFQPFIDANYDIVFLSDFMTELGDSVNSNYYSLIDQLVAARGSTFFGCWYSTVTGYINRLRGYHTSMDHTSKSYTDGIIPSWYYTLQKSYDQMRIYYPVTRKGEFFTREFPIAWRLIDSTIDITTDKGTTAAF